MSQLLPIPEGTIIIMTMGDYSDYSIIGLARVLKELDFEALHAQYVSIHSKERKWIFSESEFVSWLHKENYIDMVDATELNIFRESKFRG
jgi:hypothetical protein